LGSVPPAWADRVMRRGECRVTSDKWTKAEKKI
jgi:hypothetical protein